MNSVRPRRAARSKPRRPTADDLLAAKNKRLPDIITRGLKVLFVGINPGLYTAAVGHHFARPGNRFWPALYASGITSRLLAPSEKRQLLQSGCGIANMVDRATAMADELTRAELIAGGSKLVAKIKRYRPQVVAVLGLTSYRVAFGHPQAKLGRQAELFGGAELWVLPNPSGLNAHYKPADYARLFRAVHRAATRIERSRPSR